VRCRDPRAIYLTDKEEVVEISRIFSSCVLGFRLTLVASLGTMAAQEGGNVGRGRPGVPPPIQITIPAFPDGGSIPPKYANTAEGSISPAIEWSKVPDATLTLALILHDADVPSRPAASTSAGSGPDDTLHWAIFNIPAGAGGVPEGVAHNLILEDGSVQLKYVEGVPRLAIGKIGYFGPSPPPSAFPVLHHYIFELYCLDVKLDPNLNSRERLMSAMAGHVLAKGVYFGVYANPSVPR
jgi:Raf kinase inhibitor-like YbhB/YbcL family protein